MLALFSWFDFGQKFDGVRALIFTGAILAFYALWCIAVAIFGPLIGGQILDGAPRLSFKLIRVRCRSLLIDLRCRIMGHRMVRDSQYVGTTTKCLRCGNTWFDLVAIKAHEKEIAEGAERKNAQRAATPMQHETKDHSDFIDVIRELENTERAETSVQHETKQGTG